MEINEKQFIAGFNNGYLLAQHEPKMLTDLLINIQPINSFISGLTFGQKEFELEQDNIQLNKLRQVRDRDGIEKSLQKE
ncbi:MAG: hypothetical protein IPG12_11130 [Saprospiraceae bacterium]|nr:hypothetical protein [Saprospiraceae bacterium]